MKKSLSLFSANLLFTLTLVLVLTLGSVVQGLHLGWGLIATEVFLIALPTLLILRLQKIPLSQTLRLKPLSALTVVLCVLLGMALYLFGMIIEAVMAQLTGMQPVSIAAALLPKTPVDMVVYFAAFAVFAPLCEELLFRGAVQGAYEERKSTLFAVTITALMFAFYHLRLSGLPALLPVAFVLGYVVWRTRSIFAGMLVHFGNNGASAFQNVYYFATGKGLPFLSIWSALAGLLIAVLLIFLITKLYPHPARDEQSKISTAEPGRSWLANYWPLFVAGSLYFAVAGMTLVTSLVPAVSPASDIQYGLPIMHGPVLNHYGIENQGGEKVGEMDCTLTPSSLAVQLDCSRTIRAFQYQSGSSYYQDANHTDAIRAAWDAKTMKLLRFSETMEFEDGTSFYSFVENGVLNTTDLNGTQAVELPQFALVEFEWAWHASLVIANSGQSFSVPYASLMTWDESVKKSTPLVKDQLLLIGDDETLSLPGGDLIARKINLAGRAAWYARADAVAGLPRPVKFDDGMFVYFLEH